MKILKRLLLLALFLPSMYAQAQTPECDCTGEEEMDICVDFGEGFIVPMSECLFDCFIEEGIPVTLADCEDMTDYEDWDEEEDDFDPEWDTEDFVECDCDESEGSICINFEDGVMITNSECIYNCLSETGVAIELGECEEIDFEDWEWDEDEEWDDEDWGDDDYIDCDCEDEEEVFVCADMGDGFVFEISECEFDCLVANGFPLELGDCDDLYDYGDWEDEEWEDEDDWDFEEFVECDCEGEEELVCVDMGDGFVVEMLECEFNCLVENGLPLELGDCDDLFDFEEFEDEFDCECMDEEDFDVCVMTEEGDVFPFCSDLAELFGLEIVDCLEYLEGEQEGLEALAPSKTDISNSISDLIAYPNPMPDNKVFIEMNSQDEFQANILLMNVNGTTVYTERVTVLEGDNTFFLEMDQMNRGVYTIVLMADEAPIKTKSVIRN